MYFKIILANQIKYHYNEHFKNKYNLKTMKKIVSIISLSIFISSCSIIDEKSDVNNRDVNNLDVNNLDVNNRDKVFKKVFKNVVKRLNQERMTPSFGASLIGSASKESSYKKAVSLIGGNQTEQGLNILQGLVNKFPDYSPAKDALDKIESPFSLASSIVERYLEDWINAPSNIPEFNIAKPLPPEPLERPIVIKDEFETINEFKLRVEIAEKEFRKESEIIKNTYQSAVDEYNSAVSLFDTKVDWERKSRAEKIPSMRKRYLDVAFAEVLGSPMVKDIIYDADNEVFYGKIISEFSNLALDVKIPVILSEAKQFKENIVNLKPLIKIDLIDGNIVFSKLVIKNNGKPYYAKLLSSERVLAAVPTITIGKQNIDLNDVNFKRTKSLKVKQIIKDNRQFFTPKI